MRRLAALLLLAALTVGCGGEDSYFMAGEPAPPDVTRRLVEEGTAERIGPRFVANPEVIAQAAHGVAALETSSGRVLLWAAPTAGNAICYFVEFERLSKRAGSPQGESHCGYRPVPTEPARTVPIVLVLHRVTIDRSEVAILVGWTHDSIESVSLRSPTGDERQLAVFEHSFIAEIPANRVPRDPRGEAYEIVGKDGAGDELPGLPVTELAGWREKFPKVTGPKRTVIETADSRGRPMRLLLIPTEGGNRCAIETRNGTSGGGCAQPRERAGIQVHPTLMGSIVFVNGSVGPEVAKLELHHQDGYFVELPLVERFVLHGIPRARFEDGKRPILLVARDRSGAELAREKVGQTAFGPNSAIWSGSDVGP
jgi:hypothetical protein